MSLKDNLLGILNNGNVRSVKAKKNIIASFGIKGISIIIGFIFVPLLIDYLGTFEYGIWITLGSIVGWINYFDIGLGNGLRNKFTEALAKDEKKLAQIYVSTTYAALSMIFGAFFVIFLTINPFLNWSTILNGPEAMRTELNTLAIITIGFFLLRFIFRIIAIIITADQRPAISNTFDPLSNIIALGVILVLMKTTEPSLINLGLVLGGAPVLVLILATLYFFNKKYKEYRPVLKLVNFQYFKDLAGLGFQFFIIQITVVVIMSTNNLIITQVVGPDAVTAYSVAYKYFGLISMLFVIITNTYWSAFTEAFVKKDFAWIKRVMQGMIKIWLGIIVLIAIMLAISNPFYHLWVGDKVKVPFMLSFYTALFVVVYIWYSIFIYFINGTGKIKLQLYTAVTVAIFNIPLSIFLANTLGMGASGVILGSCISYLPGAILGPIQYYKLVHEKAYGIWGK
ncbi:MAG: MATE family efflux transporter [Lentimicrobium sp.]|jgi:O-antigen/teichoic acid export membrane protein|nr:MATE family efflux transporter [Lentimicrobium sp.]